MIDADKTIEAIDKKLKEEEAKGKLLEYLLKMGFQFESVPNDEKTESEEDILEAEEKDNLQIALEACEAYDKELDGEYFDQKPNN